MERRDVLKAAGLAAGAWAAGLIDPLGAQAQAVRSPDVQAGWFADGQYKLPALPYAYDALEPHIDKETLALHHDKHHAGYVKGANDALARLAEMREKGDFSSAKAISRDFAFNVSGHLLHSIYWFNLGPKAGGEPQGPLADAIRRDFGDFARFRAQMTATTVQVEASGWGVLAFEPISGSLRIMQVEKHQDLAEWSAVPLLVIDAWEHAYYLKYQNRRADYVAAIWQAVHWDNVVARLDYARRLT